MTAGRGSRPGRYLAGCPVCCKLVFFFPHLAILNLNLSLSLTACLEQLLFSIQVIFSLTKTTVMRGRAEPEAMALMPAAAMMRLSDRDEYLYRVANPT